MNGSRKSLNRNFGKTINFAKAGADSNDKGVSRVK